MIISEATCKYCTGSNIFEKNNNNNNKKKKQQKSFQWQGRRHFVFIDLF